MLLIILKMYVFFLQTSLFGVNGFWNPFLTQNQNAQSQQTSTKHHRNGQIIRHSKSRLHNSHFTENINEFYNKYDEKILADFSTPNFSQEIFRPSSAESTTTTTQTATTSTIVDTTIITTIPPTLPDEIATTTRFNPERLYKHLENLLDLKYSANDNEETLEFLMNTTDTENLDTIERATSKVNLDKLPLGNVFQRNPQVDVVTHFLRIVESQHILGENCTAGTDLNLGEGVVDRYAQERFRVEADVAVNRANMLTRLWKYADSNVLNSEYLLHSLVFAMVEFDDDIFAAGNCYDEYQYKDYWLYCPYAYRLPEGPVLVKDLAVEYKYLSNTSEWFYIARKNAEKVIKNYNQFSRGSVIISTIIYSKRFF